MDKQLPYPTLSAKLSWAERYAKMSSNGIDARLFSLACDLHQCSVSPAWCGDASPALLLSVLIITSVWNHVLHCLLWHLNIPQTMKVCVCVHVCVSPHRVFSANTNHSALLFSKYECAYSLHPTQSCCMLRHQVNVYSVIWLFPVVFPQLNQAGSKWRPSHNFHSCWIEWRWKKSS